jgi:6-phosphogluconate dehydrogenase
MLDRITQAYQKDPALPNLMLDEDFAREVVARQPSWRRIVSLCVACGIPCPAMSASLTYFDQFRRANLPSNLLQAQRDFFGSHTFERTDKPAGEWFHCKWTDEHA